MSPPILNIIRRRMATLLDHNIWSLTIAIRLDRPGVKTKRQRSWQIFARIPRKLLAPQTCAVEAVYAGLPFGTHAHEDGFVDLGGNLLSQLRLEKLGQLRLQIGAWEEDEKCHGELEVLEESLIGGCARRQLGRGKLDGGCDVEIG